MEVHVEAPSLLNEEALHAAQVAPRPPRLYRPAAQGEHACPERKVPAGHTVRVQDEDPAVLKTPDGHTAQSAVPPAPNFPAGHIAQALSLTAGVEYPGGHEGAQKEDALVLYVFYKKRVVAACWGER